MQHLPQPILGNITAITITSPDLDKSLAFYEKLGFSLVLRDNWPFPWVQVSDGVLLIMLRKSADHILALTYYVPDIDAVVQDLTGKGISFYQSPQKGDVLRRYVFRTPDGLPISLVGMTQGFSQPPGPGMLQMKLEDYSRPEKYVNKTAGLYGELAQPVADLEISIAFWEKLGFRKLSAFTTPYPWAILSDGLAVVGLHQATHFSRPAITYFASDMKVKIAALKKAGLNPEEQDESNATVTTPEQQQIFLYQLGGMPKAEKKKTEIKTPVIETERLVLKELNPEVAEQLFTTRPDEEIIAFMGLRGEQELQVEKSKWQRGMTTYRTSYKRFLLTEKASGNVIGSCGYHNWYAEHNRAEIGYHMKDDSVKRKGFMSEAVKAMLVFGFEKMGLNRVEAFTSPDNVPSIKMLKGLGFTEEGILLSHYFKDGVMHDSAVFRLLKGEYKKAKKAWKK